MLASAVILLSAGLLLVGFITPVVAVVVGLFDLALALSIQDGVELLVLTAVIALLGPGAFSIDARLFGRREVFIPRRS